MPLSELLAKTAKPKPNSTMNTPTSNSPFCLSDNEFAELLWENGQIVTHDHSARPTKFPQALPDQRRASTSKFFAHKQLHENDSLGPAATAADDENMVPWTHYSLHDSVPSSPLPPDALHADFCSGFFQDFAGANPSTLGFTTTQPAAAAATSAARPAAASTKLSKAETGVTNFSLFKDRLVSGARASTSTKHCNSDLRNATDRDRDRDRDRERDRDRVVDVHADEKESNKKHEPMLASSSVCSANDEGVESAEPKHAGKRKIREPDESSSNSEDLDDESAGEKRAAIGRGSSAKKSRAAEVHNLSERRRRERINEKMKALQELIPNCSKADKASMLDDAIEYLKTLQLQVQMMSMGNGMYMPPPLMIPPMMQPLRAPHMAHYPPLGMGLYQMGMYPQLHHQQFIQGPPAMHGMIASMPVCPQVPVPASVNMQPAILVSSSENASTAAAGAGVGSTHVRENAGASSPAKPDPKAEML